MFLKLINPISAIKIYNFDGFALKMLINGAFLYFSMKHEPGIHVDNY
jgi:hypothetical protein